MMLTRRHERWMFAAAAFGLAVLVAALAVGAGVRVELGERDLTIAAALLLEAGMAAAGFAVGRSVEARRAERREQATERQRLEELTALQARLGEMRRLAAVGELGATVAHEIRNPLAIIRSMVQNVADADPPADSVRETCRAVIEEIDRVSRVTTALVDLSKPTALQLTTVDADLVLARTEWLARRLLDGRGVALRVRAGGTLRPFPGDPDLLCQVLLELVSNAAAATPPGGEIVIESQAIGESVVLSVSDQGPGLAPEDADRVFDPFFSRKAGGTGLGLAVARQLVQRLGGTLSAGSAGTGGARFEIRMPAAVRA